MKYLFLLYPHLMIWSMTFSPYFIVFPHQMFPALDIYEYFTIKRKMISHLPFYCVVPFKAMISFFDKLSMAFQRDSGRSPSSYLTDNKMLLKQSKAVVGDICLAIHPPKSCTVPHRDCSNTPFSPSVHHACQLPSRFRGQYT